MQQSFFEATQDEEGNDLQPHAQKFRSPPDQKMYAVEIPFYESVKDQLQQAQSNIHKVLISLSNCPEGENRRLPYNVFVSLERSLKELRRVKSKLVQENKKIAVPLSERQKIKNIKNSTFKTYLKTLNQKRHELKERISRLEAIVQKMEDNGYAQYVNYDVIVPEVYSIRLSYCSRQLLKFAEMRDRYCIQLTKQLGRRKKLIEEVGLKYKLESLGSLPLMRTTKVSTLECLKELCTYNYFVGERIMKEKSINLKLSIKAEKVKIEKLKQSIEETRKKIWKEEFEGKISTNERGLTSTDYMIYLKDIKKQLDKILEIKILINLPKKSVRCRSVPK